MSPLGRIAVLLRALCLSTSFLGIFAWDSIRPRVPGVAFGLSHDYGTAAIHFKNGTSYPVAWVQGSPAYRSLMRHATAGPPLEASPLCQWVTPVLDRLPAALGLDISSCRSADLLSIKTLMLALKTAVESRLGTNFCFAALTFDDPSSHQTRVAQEALRQIGLRQIAGVGRTDQHAIRILSPDREPNYNEDFPDRAPKYYKEPWLVLAIGYDTDWYNIGLHEIEEGVLSFVEGFARGLRFDVENQVEAAKDELRNMASRFDKIHRIVLYGKERENPELLGLLTEMLGPELVNDAHVDGSIWTSTKSMAKVAHVRMDHPQFDTVPASDAAFGCKWLSMLYRDSHEEL